VFADVRGLIIELVSKRRDSCRIWTTNKSNIWDCG